LGDGPLVINNVLATTRLRLRAQQDTWSLTDRFTVTQT
jgi:hypothetical protein